MKVRTDYHPSGPTAVEEQHGRLGSATLDRCEHCGHPLPRAERWPDVILWAYILLFVAGVLILGW